MLFNLGEEPKQAYKERRPATRMGTAALIRTALTDAANFLQKRRQKPNDPPERNLKHEALALALEKKVSAMFCAQRADDILTALRLTDEFRLDGVVALAAEGYLITDKLAQSKIPVIAHPPMQRVGGEMETYNSFLGNTAALSDAGIRTAIGTGFEGYVPKTRVVRHEAAIGMVYGLGFERALSAVTLDAARILKIDDRYGSIEPGKIADLVLYDGDPFEHATHVTQVIVDGRLAYDRARRQPLDFAQRMFLFTPEIPCCLGW